MNYDMLYIHPNKKARGTASTEPNNTKIVHISRSGCNIHVTPAPKSVIGSIDYYYDLTKADSNEDWLSRHFDFIHRHKGCQHSPPEYYQHYGDKYIRRFTDELFPKLSERGKAWLVNSRRLLQRYMENGFESNLLATSVITACEKNNKYSATTKTNNTESLELTNELFTKFAFNTHPPAYIDGGLGNLPFSDLLEISMTPDFKDLLSENGRQQIGEILGFLLGRYLEDPNLILDNIKYDTEKATKSVIHSLERQGIIDEIKRRTTSLLDVWRS